MHFTAGETAMPGTRRPSVTECNCLAVRQAARSITQFYDHHLAPSGLRTSQFGVLAMLERKGPLTINELAAEFVIDRTTLGRNILPLQRDGLIAVKPSPFDRRSKELHLTEAGRKRFLDARRYWVEAQNGFETRFGTKRAAELRAMLHAVVESDEAPAASVALH
jgi:DNA-binding MarR family transcriptional regulator